MAEVSASEDLLERVRRIVGTNKERRLSTTLEKSRRQCRKDCRKRKVTVPKLTYKPVEADMLKTRKNLNVEHENLLDRLTKKRREMQEGEVEKLQKPRLEKILDSIETMVNAVDIEGQICEPGDDGVSTNSTVGHPNLKLMMMEELSKDISTAQTIRSIIAMQLVATSISVSSPPAKVITNTTSSQSFASPFPPNTNLTSSSPATSSPTPMDVGSVVEVRTSLPVPTSSGGESAFLSPLSMDATSSPPVKVVVLSKPRVRRSTPRVLSPRVKNDVPLAASTPAVTTETPLRKVDSSTKPLVTRTNNELMRLLHEIQRVADTDNGYSKRHYSLRKR